MSNATPEQGICEQVRQTLARFRVGGMSLRELVDALDILWNSLPESRWSEEFRSHWWTLEQVYAVALDRGEIDSLPADAIADIEEAVTGLEGLIGAAE